MTDTEDGEQCQESRTVGKASGGHTKAAVGEIIDRIVAVDGNLHKQQAVLDEIAGYGKQLEIMRSMETSNSAIP